MKFSELTDFWFDQFPPRLLFPQQFQGLSLFALGVSEEQTQQALVFAPSRETVATALLSPEDRQDLDWPWYLQPTSSQKSPIFINRLLQGDTVPDCPEALVLGSSPRRIATPNLLLETAAIPLPAQLHQFGDECWCWPNWICIPDVEEFVLEVPVLNTQTERAYRIRCLFRRNQGLLRYLGWKVQTRWEPSRQEIQSQPLEEMEEGEIRKLEDCLRSLLRVSEEEWESSNHARREKERRYQWQQRWERLSNQRGQPEHGRDQRQNRLQ